MLVLEGDSEADERHGFAGSARRCSWQRSPQILALVTRGQQRLSRFFDTFDRQLAGQEFVTGERISVADITALCAIDFAENLAKVSIPEAHQRLRRWYDMMSARPSAKA